MLIVLGGAVAITGNAYQGLVSGWSLFLWLLLLSAMSAFQIVLTYTLTSTYIAPPRSGE
jgi:hypothetical protein